MRRQARTDPERKRAGERPRRVREPLQRGQDRAGTRASGHVGRADARGRSGRTRCYTATGAGTQLAAGKETREIGGRTYVLEYALPGDVAIVECWEADRWGNLTYRKSGRNFNPVMAAAGRLTIAQSQHMVELGELDPEVIATPGIFVNRVVHVPHGDPQG